MEITRLDARRATQHLGTLAEILRQSVEDGALVGFILPFGTAEAEAYWQGVFKSVADGERRLLCAMEDGKIVGTVQLYLSPEPNAPHRAEVFKLLVHRAFQRQGVGGALMRAVEDEARRLRRSLLLLDTAQGSASERLYRRLGWREVGTIARHFVDPFGAVRSSVYFMKFTDEDDLAAR